MRLIPLKLSVTTCYLIQTEDKYLLIDTGYREDWALFCRRLKEVGVSPDQIGYLLLTHHHDDHCGLLPDILRENGAVRVVMSDACAALIRRGQNDLTHGGGLLNRRVAFLVRRKQAYVSLILHQKIDKSQNLKFTPYEARPNDIVFTEEPTLRALGIPLDGRILATPGHTVDSVSVLFPDGDCAVGDAVAHMLAFAGTRYCVIFICDMAEYYRSWEKLIRSGAKRILPAHGAPFPVDRLTKNLWKNKAENRVLY
jgi:glyoxylase-like metal-dependent hydrolase (beta-lactamase superfamily II)